MAWFSVVATAIIATPACAKDQAAGVRTFAARHGYVSQNVISAEMAQCALKRDHDAAEAVAAANDQQASQRAMLRVRPAMIACLKGRASATLSGLQVSGAIADELLRADRGAMLDRLAVSSPRTPIRIADGDGAWHRAVSCAVAGAPQHAAALLRAQAGSPTEAEAFRAMMPTLQACVPASGSVTLKPSGVRATVAIAAYQLVKGAPAPGGMS